MNNIIQQDEQQFTLYKILLLLFILTPCYAGKLTLQVKRPNHSIILRENKKIAQFHPNASLHWGVKYLADKFYIEYGQKIPGTNYNNSSVGNNSYKDYRLGLYYDNLFAEVFYKEYVGFSSNEEDNSQSCSLCSERDKLTSREFNFLSLLAINSDFSMRALTSSGLGGVEGSSSFILSLFLNKLKIKDPSSIVQNDKVTELPGFSSVNEIEMKQFGLGIGYAGIIDLAQIAYFGLYGGAGIGLQKYNIVGSNSRSGTGVSGQWGLRLNLGTQGESLTFGLKGLLFSSVFDLGSNSNVITINYSIYCYLVFPL